MVDMSPVLSLQLRLSIFTIQCLSSHGPNNHKYNGNNLETASALQVRGIEREQETTFFT